MSAQKIIRAQAREKLKNSGWTKALLGLALILIMYMFIESFAYLEVVVLDLYTMTDTAEFIVKVAFGSLVTAMAFLLSPVLLGYAKMLCTENVEYNMSDVVYYFVSFKRYFKAVAFVFAFVFRMIIPTLLSFSLVFILIAIKHFWLHDFTGYTVMLVLFTISAVVFALRYAIRYFLSFYLMCFDESKPLYYYFKTSKMMMREHEKDVVKLSNSFIAWILLCITVLPLLYVLPYYIQSMCISAKWLSQLSRNE